MAFDRLPLTATALLLTAAAVAIAALVQGSVGVGFALLVAPVLAALAPAQLPVCLLVLMIPLNVYVAWRERRALDFAGAGWITAGRFFGTFGGVWILTALSASRLGMLVGATTILAAVATLIAPSFKPSPRAQVATGVVTGISETATGIGGPPLALLYQHHPAPVLRSTIAFCFVVGEVLSLGLLALAGRAHAEQFATALVLLPALAVGALASRLVHRRIAGRVLRALVLVFAIGSGTLLLLRG